MMFTTKDKDNDKKGYNCAQHRKGAWWYKYCFSSNLNGLYLSAGWRSLTGIIWSEWKKDWRSMKNAEMKIRATSF